MSEADGGTHGALGHEQRGSSDRMRGLAIALGGVLLYVLLHAGFRLLASSTLGEDDTLDQILVQELRAGYNPRQPPLYDWVLFYIQKALGTGVLSFLAIKYAALTATVVKAKQPTTDGADVSYPTCVERNRQTVFSASVADHSIARPVSTTTRVAKMSSRQSAVRTRVSPITGRSRT